MLQLITEPKFVYFDIGGVLLNLRETPFEFAKKFALDAHQVSMAMKEHVLDGCTGKMPMEEFWKKLLLSAGATYNESENYTELWNSAAKIMTQGHDLFYELADKYSVGLFTNAWQDLLENALHSKLLPDYEFSIILDSCKVGYVKPQREIYEIAEKLCGFSGPDILFIDDTRVNIEAAKGRGWQTLLVDFTE